MAGRLPLDEVEQKSRVFIGNITPETTAEDIRKRFEVHGPIANVNRNVKGFAFVQFENEPDAKEAIAKENGRLFKGKKMEVKPAVRNIVKESSGVGEPVKGGDQGGRFGGGRDNSRERDRGAGGSWGGDRDFRAGGGGDRDFRAGGGGDRDFRAGGSGGGGYPPPLMSLGTRGMTFGGSSRENLGGSGGGGFRGGSWGESDGGVPQVVRAGPSVSAVAMEKPNDVEIICLNKHTRAYAEAVEARLKNMGLTVDVLFPNPDIPLGKVLGNIAGRGVMYAVCVAPDNELHRSLTVNVLQGEQQEHRNMPLDEAMSFVGKSFSRFIEKPAGGRLGYAVSGGVAGMGGNSAAEQQLPAFGHPNDIRTILGFLIDDRPMSIMEYDKLIKYLATRRESTLKAEYGMNIPAHLLLPPVGPMQDPVLKAKQEEIQNKVMEILSRPRKTQATLQMGSMAATPALGVRSSGSAGLTALNPALQQAIDSLVKTGPNLLSSLGKTGSSAGGGEGGGSSASGGDNGNLGGYYSSLFGSGGGSGSGSVATGAFK